MNKLKPILFNTEMVQAILEGRKTATRRLIKPPYYIDDEEVCRVSGCAIHTGTNLTQGMPYPDNLYDVWNILYVRETWAFMCCLDCDNCILDPIPGDELCAIHKTPTIYEDKDSISEGCYIYRADYPRPDRIIWRPSIHMPKAAARIWLEVTHVRIQRLQEMTLDDFLSEGVTIRPEAYNAPDNAYMQARHIFTSIWDSTIQPQDKDKYGWAANPWVWVYDFKRQEKPEVQDV